MNSRNPQIELGDIKGTYFDFSYVAQVSCESRGTEVRKQIEFIEQNVLTYFKCPKILDLCCGHGRHLEILFKKGFNVTGVDINKSFIDIARQRTNDNVLLICCNAKQFVDSNAFDIVLNLETSLNCFNYEDALLVLSNIYQSLQREGILLLHVFNPEFAIQNLSHRTWLKAENGTIFFEEREFDTNNSIVTITQNRLLPLNNEDTYQESTHKIRLTMFTYDKLSNMLTKIGFDIRQVYGNFQGATYRADLPDLIFACSK